jgi:hypothetical protein
MYIHIAIVVLELCSHRYGACVSYVAATLPSSYSVRIGAVAAALYRGVYCGCGVAAMSPPPARCKYTFWPPVLWIQIFKDPHHFAGSGSATFLKKVIRIRPIHVDYF